MNGILFFLITCAVFCFAEQYIDRYDDLNIDEILENKRLVNSYVKCLLDTGRCTPEGLALKEHIKDGLQTGCIKCTKKQRQGARKVVKYIRENQQNYWTDVLHKYDPKDEYKDIYEAFLASDD